MNANTIQPLLPASCHCASTALKAAISPLWPEEQTQSQHFSPSRLRSFQAGRSCARDALSLLGIPHSAILRDEDQLPCWPAGTLGSISHCQDMAIACVARSEQLHYLGIDIENICTDIITLQTQFTCDQELQHWQQHLSTGLKTTLTLLFSAKESVYKALYPRFKLDLDFSGIGIHPGTKTHTFEIQLSHQLAHETQPLHGYFKITAEHVFTACLGAR